jgi:NAD(P)-dependent dehydrogenase (short-subunit alcohol dehydrogenase family)
MLKFQDKVALITGSGTGIGQAIAKSFCENGASVIILGRRKEPLEETAKILEEIITKVGSNAFVKIFSGIDVSEEKSVTAMFDSLKESNTKVDILVNNAGVSGPVTCFPNAPLNDFKSTVSIHLTGTFWTSVQALRVMEKGGKIITISTFFAEERPLEQRPYRFRGPYTASQGAKNRLAEAMSWELVDKGIVSIATNPGPVHSDRIYKTVYPKAASTTLSNLLTKIQTVAEKIQKNTSKMIADEQFLSQPQVAETVLGLCDDKLSAIVNGKVIPGDRVFYPVRPHVTTSAPPVHQPDFSSKVIAFTIDSIEKSDLERIEFLAQHVEKNGGKAICLISDKVQKKFQDSVLNKFHSHVINLKDPDEVARGFERAKTQGEIIATVHVTGKVPEISKLIELSRQQWDDLVDQFINTPAIIAQKAIDVFVPGGGKDPRLFKDKKGTVIIIGPDLPIGKKVSVMQRAKVEVFRGALRPFTTTINQELSDVLKSKVRVFSVFTGGIDGREPNNEHVAQALNYFTTEHASSSAEVIFCVDEIR